MCHVPYIIFSKFRAPPSSHQIRATPLNMTRKKTSLTNKSKTPRPGLANGALYCTEHGRHCGWRTVYPYPPVSLGSTLAHRQPAIHQPACNDGAAWNYYVWHGTDLNTADRHHVVDFRRKTPAEIQA